MDKIFAPISWYDPNQNAPTFIKGSLWVKPAEFKQFMEDNIQHITEKGWLKITMKESKTGKIYFELDTWKPEHKVPETEETIQVEEKQGNAVDPVSGIDTEDIPF